MSQTSLVRAMVVFLCAGALLLIVVILVGSEIDETSGKAIGTAIAIPFFSLTAVAGTNLSLRRPELAVIGHLTAAVSAIAFVVMVASIWTADGDDWKPAAYLLLVAFAAAHTSLLLVRVRASDPDALRLLRTGTLLAMWLLVILACTEIASPGEDVGPRAIGVVAVLYTLGTILLPLIRRIGERSAAEAAPPATISAPAPAAAAASPLATAPHPFPDAAGLDHVVIAVSHWERSNAFYRDVLGAEVISMPGPRVAYRLGAQLLNVHGPGIEATPLAAEPVRPGNSDLCFAWRGTPAEAIEHLGRHGVEVILGPVGRTGARGPGQSVYCRDPDGSLIELIAYG